MEEEPALRPAPGKVLAPLRCIHVGYLALPVVARILGFEAM